MLADSITGSSGFSARASAALATLRQLYNHACITAGTWSGWQCEVQPDSEVHDSAHPFRSESLPPLRPVVTPLVSSTPTKKSPAMEFLLGIFAFIYGSGKPFEKEHFSPPTKAVGIFLKAIWITTLPQITIFHLLTRVDGDVTAFARHSGRSTVGPWGPLLHGDWGSGPDKLDASPWLLSSLFPMPCFWEDYFLFLCLVNPSLPTRSTCLLGSLS